MKRILVPTDFSACANNAINYAVQAAKFFAGEVVLMHSCETMGPLYTDYMGANKDYEQQMRNEATEKLKQLKNVIVETENVEVSIHLDTGKVKENILKAVEDYTIDIVILGAWGIGGFKDKVWGNITTSLIGSVPVPMIVIPYDYEWSPPKKILLAINNFEEDQVLLNPIFEFASYFNAQLYVVVFTDQDKEDAVQFMNHSREIVYYKQHLKNVFHNDTLIAEHLSGHRFEDTLQEFIEKNNIDMLAMFPHQRHFPDRMFHRSMTKRMSHHLNVPLLVVPVVSF